MWGRFNSSAAKRVAIAATLLIALAVAAAVAIAAAGPADPVISTAPANPTNSTGASFTFSAPPSGGSNQCRIDSAAMGACTTPTTKTYSGLAAGTHTFAVQAVDNKGKTSNVVSYTWVVDLTPPAIASITRLDTSPTNASSVRWSVTLSEPVTGVDAGDFARTGSGLSATSISGVSGSGTSYTVIAGTGTGDGTLGVKLVDDDTIKDAAGNRLGGTGAGNGDFGGPSYTLDRTPPGNAPVITAGPSGTVAATSASLGFNSAESGVAGFQCMRDGSAWVTCTSPQAYSGLAQGAHTFAVRALDATGNPGPGASRGWSVDTVAPAAPQLGQKPADPSTTATTTFSWSDASVDVASYECSRENGAFQVCSSPLTYAATTTSNGMHQFVVRAIDGAGNVSAVTSYGWKIDKGSPQQFTMTGSVSGLVPGVARRVPVVISNPNDVPIYVTSITTTLSSGPGSSGCGLSNFDVLQSSASATDPVVVPASGMVTLNGPLDGYAPRVRLLDLPVNQDACKGVLLSLSFSGSAHS
jgi:hypothetical protein